MLYEEERAALRETVLARLETIVDPCSVAAGARAGLVSMGLVGEVTIEARAAGAHVGVTLFVTEPTCLMGAIFEAAAERELGALPGVGSVAVRTDRARLWTPDAMTPDYRRRLAQFRAAQAALRKTTKADSGASRLSSLGSVEGPSHGERSRQTPE